MVKLELDLNKLSDEQLVMYLKLKGKTVEEDEETEEEKKPKEVKVSWAKTHKPWARLVKFTPEAIRELKHIYIAGYPDGEHGKQLEKFEERWNVTHQSTKTKARDLGFAKLREKVLTGIVKHKTHYTKYTKEIIDEIKAIYVAGYGNKKHAKKLKALCRKYKVRKNTVYVKASEMGFTKLRKECKDELKNTPDSVVEGNPYLMRTHAVVPKSFDEKRKELADKSTKPLYFPRLSHFKSELKEILIGMLKNIVENKALKLTFPMEGFALGIEEVELWNDFCVDFMIKSEEISDFLGIANKFNVKKNPGRGGHEIFYQ